MSKSELHDWECEIEELSGNNADKMLGIARDIYKTAFVRGRNSMTWEQTRWIPCSERLPEERGVYIVTEKVFSIDDRKHTGRFNLMTEQVEFHNGKWRRANFYEVIAWMPLPKPYKAEMESEE